MDNEHCLRVLSLMTTLAAEVIGPPRQPTRPWLRRRQGRGFSSNLVQELEDEDESEFKRMFRMNPDIFNGLLNLVKNEWIEPVCHKYPVPIKTLLEITLRFLSDGTSYPSLSHAYRVSVPYISRNVPKMCDTISRVLQNFTTSPKTREEWETIEAGFRQQWNFPHVLGAVDGKHISILKPKSSGSQFYNYKGYFSVILLAACDADGRIIAYDVGRPGSQGDAGIYYMSHLSSLLEEDPNVPPPTSLEGYPEKPIPYFWIGDDAFPLSNTMMKGFPASTEKGDERIFNYRLSRARRTIECAFGVMAQKFRLLLKPIPLQPGNAVKAVKSIIALHNFLPEKGCLNVDFEGVADDDTVECQLDGMRTTAGRLQPNLDSR